MIIRAATTCQQGIYRPLPGGPNGQKVGADDFLLDHGPGELWRLFDEAQEPEPPDPDTLKQPAADLLPEDEAGRFLAVTRQDGFNRLAYWRDAWWYWAAGCYRELTESEVRAKVARLLNQSYFKVDRGRHARRTGRPQQPDSG